MTDKIITVPAMGNHGRDHYDFGLGDGNELGYVTICLWPNRNFGHRERTTDDWRGRVHARRIALRDLIAKFVEDDEECQRVLRDDRDDRAAEV